jgi:hypothetical protein
MENDELRYSGRPTNKWFYMTEFLVECPKCSAAAMVNLESSFASNDGKLFCSNCSHAEKAADRIRYKLIVKRNCDNCGKFFEKIIPDHKEKTETVKVPCPECGSARSYKPVCEAYRLMYDPKGAAYDPVFNLPLWLQAEIKDDLFWAYNRPHMNDIKDYVKSKLRERPSPHFTTMVEKLPHFIKDSKNRDLLIKIIERLEKK